jgi:hypothetical protein
MGSVRPLSWAMALTASSMKGSPSSATRTFRTRAGSLLNQFGRHGVGHADAQNATLSESSSPEGILT